MQKKIVLFFFFLVSACSLEAKEGIRELVRRGNIVTNECYDGADVGRYIGNGRFGTVIGATGLNLSPEEQQNHKTGASHISHLLHWGRFAFTSAIEKTATSADYNLPIMKFYLEERPGKEGGYLQEQDFYDGTVETEFRSEDGKTVHSLVWFDYKKKNLAGFRVDVDKEGVVARMKIATDFLAYPFVFRDTVRQYASIEREGDNYRMTVSCPQSLNRCSSEIYIYSSAPLEICDNGVRIAFRKGRNSVFLSYGEPVRLIDRIFSLPRSRRAWHKVWHSTGWMSFPDDRAQQLWIRSMAYMLASLDDFEYGLIQPDNGFTGNPFPFHFVQDLEYIAPALMMTGHNDIVMRWVEKFAGEIEQMKSYAKHLWPESEGIYPPWELPFGPIDGYHSPNVPVAFCYEPHNCGYLCRLAREAADFCGDAEWAETYAFPLIKEVCNFYRSACHKENDGLWHMAWWPCIGQDEAGGRNKTDYLCSIYSAQYSFRTAVELGLDKDGSLKGILDDGLAFQSLCDDSRGTLHSCRGADDFGRQKHPVQLDGLAYFPIWDSPRPFERKAYELRHDITQDAKKPKFYGWTLGQFLLSGSNMKDREGWLEDWNSLRPSDYTDKDWIQIYETSGNPLQAFYVTTHAMVEQSLIRNYVNDYWGTLDIAACPVFDGNVQFGNIDTRFGVRVSGSVSGKSLDLCLEALRNCSFSFGGQDYNIKKGRKIRVKRL